MNFQVFLVTIALVGFAFAIIGIKMFLQKGGMFTKSCSSVDTSTGQKIGCSCDAEGDETKCVNYEKHHGVLKA
ncbi:MAG: hypothetical protein GXO89_07605 [Chlorobi bacterium]|nr:hypothetical protein [Chlorobiota bacterium]